MQWDDRTKRRFKLRDLDVLMAVVQAGGIGKAAVRLGVSQPAISKSVADLEKTLGIRLLERSRQGITPTPYAAALIRRGTAIFDELRQGLQDVEFLADPSAGEVRLGAAEPLTVAVIGPAINQLSRQFPRLRFHVTVGDAAALYRGLADRRFEVALFRIGKRVPDEFDVDTLFDDVLIVATGAKSPLTRRRKLALSDLLDEPWATFPSDSPYGSLVEDVFRSRGLNPPQPTVASLSPYLLNELRANGHFLSIIPRFSLELPRRHPSIAALPISLPETRMPVGIVTLKNRVLSPRVKLFLDRLRLVAKPLAKLK
jgi:DNA-binding transcriptional LysR family regulator